MKLLRCKLCSGEVDIIKSNKAINKKVKCRKCGFSNLNEKEKENDVPDVMVIKLKK
jgi:hypothetical protein